MHKQKLLSMFFIGLFTSPAPYIFIAACYLLGMFNYTLKFRQHKEAKVLSCKEIQFEEKKSFSAVSILDINVEKDTELINTASVAYPEFIRLIRNPHQEHRQVEHFDLSVFSLPPPVSLG